MCSSVTRCYLVYEYYPFDLRKDIKDLQKFNLRYQEIEIVAMLKCVVIILITISQAPRANLSPDLEQITWRHQAIYYPHDLAINQ
jgi:hypothetical protein